VKLALPVADFGHWTSDFGLSSSTPNHPVRTSRSCPDFYHLPTKPYSVDGVDGVDFFERFFVAGVSRFSRDPRLQSVFGIDGANNSPAVIPCERSGTQMKSQQQVVWISAIFQLFVIAWAADGGRRDLLVMLTGLCVLNFLGFLIFRLSAKGGAVVLSVYYAVLLAGPCAALLLLCAFG
jgi:hypothetical protein